MKKNDNPLLLWFILWLLTAPALYIRNGIMNQQFTRGGNFFLGLLVSLVIGLVEALISLVGYWILNYVMKLVAPKKTLGNKDILIVWLIVFAFIFIIPLLRS